MGDSFSSELCGKSERFVSEIGETCDAFKQEIQQRNAQICASQSELSVLTDAFMTAQRECTETEGRINEIAGLNHSLSGQKDVILPNKLHEIESATAQKQRLLHEKKLNYKDMILSQENKLKGYLARVARFEDNLALCCSANKGTESVRCAF